MGGSSYNSGVTRSYIAARRASNVSTMGHTVAVAEGRAERRVHPKLDPKVLNRVTNTVMRDSRDNSAQPESVAVAIIFDTTASMRQEPEKFVKKLPDLMDTLIDKGYLRYPQILFGAINDATTDAPAPLEIGQFESGNQMDDVLTNILLQGGGGNGITESYELAMYFMARHTALDCLEKRNKKGYLFIIGDEVPYSEVNPAQVERLIGDTLQAPIPTTEIIAELKQKYNVYWLFPRAGANFATQSAHNTLRGYFGQNYMILDRSEDISKIIAETIARNEGVPIANPEVAAAAASVPPRRMDDLD